MNSLEAACRYNSQINSVAALDNKRASFDNYCYQFVTHSIVSVRERLLALPEGSWLFWDLDETLSQVQWACLEKVG